MERVTNGSMWCCIVSRRHNGAVKTNPFFILKTIASSKRMSVDKYEELVRTDGEIRTLTFERCVRINIKEAA